MSFKILITDSLHRKTYDVISAIKHRFSDIPLIIGDSKQTIFSRFNLRILYGGVIERLRVDDDSEFLNDLLNISLKYHDEKLVFIPVEESTIKLFYSFLSIHGQRNFIYLLPSNDVFELVQNKRKLNEYCIANNIGCPKSYPVNNLISLNKEFYPLLLKPSIGSGSKGIIRLYSPEDISEVTFKVIASTEYLVQELIENGKDVIGAFFLYSKGQYINAYSHERIRTSPSTGGVTVLSKFSNNADVISLGKQLLDKIEWNGLIMLEFLFDKKSSSYKIIEANPRIWGSILLSEFCNANLLTNYVNLCLKRKLDDSNCKTESRIRWLFPVDLLNYFKSGFRIKDFWNFKNTCFINWTFAKKWSAIYFNILSILNVNNLFRYFRR